MSGFKDIKRRINSVKSTRQITKAMKMVAAAKLRKAQDAITNARPYASKMQDVVDSLGWRVSNDAHPMLRNCDEVKKVALYVVSSDRGLCGGFNGALFRTVRIFAKQKRAEGIEVHIYAVGKKARDIFRRDEGFQKAYTDISQIYQFDLLRPIIEELNENFMDQHYDEVHVAFNQFVSALTQEPMTRRLLPLSQDEMPDDRPIEDAQRLDYTYEPNDEKLLAQLLPKHVEVQMHTMMLDSVASEHAARMTAMDAATNNASDMIEKLTLQYNRARQAAITTELTEIIAGAEAL
ncbi:ATP synthase F1 subunit gamma [Desulfurispira natronophila]|uniref:ATP synthase gamma chain n=1 Tax=Desulfurispira natronophila TaxID=682562 RepID=A0A7W8DG80_9BACT|nr:ATP synthase F1 subunit gamma [Desulfurispira natronophila]MBB5021089.1 F-type H+-transporting ATPase subunit gamma [Desulfurispira natronophila]